MGTAADMLRGARQKCLLLTQVPFGCCCLQDHPARDAGWPLQGACGCHCVPLPLQHPHALSQLGQTNRGGLPLALVTPAKH
jgi:hypothetical protein